MAKFYSEIGYAVQQETSPSVYQDVITKRMYCGDVLRNDAKERASGNLNENVVLSNKLSIVADPFAYENFMNMRYIEWLGTKWKITDVEVKWPRLNLTVGGVYNDQLYECDKQETNRV
jgi:hypothetical protein